MLRRLWVALPALLLLWSCTRPSAPNPTPVEKQAGPVTELSPPARPLPPGATDGKAEPECAATPTDTPVRALKVGERSAELRGTTLEFKEGDGELVLGVLGPFNEDSPANIAAVTKYLEFFTAQKADAIVVDGDIGETEEGIAHVLELLAQSKLPVLTIIGNRECRADYVAAIRSLAPRYPNLINLNQVRAVRFPEATLVSLPGYHDPNFINCAAGCRYYKSTVDEVVAIAKAAPGPVVLVSHGPPLGEGSQALDYASATGNVGDPEIRRALGQASIPFGLFTHIKEAGARATDMAGTTVVPQDQPRPNLFVNPGPANTAKWKMNDGTTGFGFAATFTLKNKQGSWKSLRLVAPAEPVKPAPKTPPGRPAKR